MKITEYLLIKNYQTKIALEQFLKSVVLHSNIKISKGWTNSKLSPYISFYTDEKCGNENIIHEGFKFGFLEDRGIIYRDIDRTRLILDKEVADIFQFLGKSRHVFDELSELISKELGEKFPVFEERKDIEIDPNGYFPRKYWRMPQEEFIDRYGRNLDINPKTNKELAIALRG